MKFYTIQQANILQTIMQTRYLTSSFEYVWNEFKPYYKWMAKQLKKRIPSLTNKSNSLIWLWDKEPTQDDLDHAFYPAASGVLLEIELDPEQVLASDFDAWCWLLMNEPVVELDENLEPVEAVKNPKDTWERVFDLPTVKMFFGRRI